MYVFEGRVLYNAEGCEDQVTPLVSSSSVHSLFLRLGGFPTDTCLFLLGSSCISPSLPVSFQWALSFLKAELSLSFPLLNISSCS